MKFSRRQLLSGSVASAGCAFATRARAVEPSALTPALIAAAKEIKRRYAQLFRV